MPKFIYTITFVSVLLWVLVVWLINHFVPDNFLIIFMFLGIIFCALSVSLSLPLYGYFHKKATSLTNLKLIYRRSIKWGVFLAIGITGTLFFKAFDLINIFNYGLFLLLYAFLFSWFKSRNRM